jgi:cytochrome c
MKRALTAAIASALMCAAAGAAAADGAKAEALLKQHNCLQCHTVDKKLLGPPYKEVAQKYKGQQDAQAKLAKSVKEGSKGVWGPIPMPPNTAVPDADINVMVTHILSM